MNKKPNVVVIGGGTGTFVVLSGLKKYDVNLSAIVAMTDSGGSTGKLRDQLGVLPPGDLRQAFVALSNKPDIWRKLFTYRFDNGDLDGHSFGNIFVSAFEKIMGSTDKAIEEISKILDVKGNVIPVTFSRCSLCAKYKDGSLVEGEDKIDNSYTKRPHIDYMYIAPEAILNPKVKEAITEADYIILGPGDLYTSVIPNLLVNGISKIIADAKAKKIYVVNLMTKLGQTDDYMASDHVYEIERYLGCFLDCVVVNTKIPNESVLKWYKSSDNVNLVEDDLREKKVTEAKIIRRDLLSSTMYKKSISDRLKRSLIRHDPKKLASVLIEIIDNKIKSK